MDTSTESNGSSFPATPKNLVPPPDIDELREQLAQLRSSSECFQFCATVDNYTQDVDSFQFENLGLRNQFGVLIYSLLEQARCQYAVMKNNEMKYDLESHNDILKQWGVSPQGETAAFTPVVNRKQKNSSPRKEITTAKKQKIEDANLFTVLGVEELPENFGDNDENPLDAEMDQHPSRTSTPLPRRRRPPPITIDNVAQSAQLLKKLQTLTGQKLQGRVIGRGLRVYPETPAAYHQIRNLIDQEKLEAYTYELNENKEIKVVIRGMPVDMPIQEIMEDLENLYIKPSECRVMLNRRTHLPMPLFLLSLPKTEDNKNIHHITEICNIKVKVEPLNKKTGPAQCFRCQGFFHSSRFCTRNPKCVKCGKPHLTRDCKKTPEEDPTCCLCQGKHPANFLGCPKNPLNKPPPPPKVNAWDERTKKRREMQEEAKRKAEQEAARHARPLPLMPPNLTPKTHSQAPQLANQPNKPTPSKTKTNLETSPPPWKISKIPESSRC
ncbi:nucleic-acid-binding protein from transposon X-element [Trichonephila clavipes]|nr:nucleic-acid-binding protein from transposon X-element [Trichonephila clavipes]